MEIRTEEITRYVIERHWRVRWWITRLMARDIIIWFEA